MRLQKRLILFYVKPNLKKTIVVCIVKQFKNYLQKKNITRMGNRKFI